MVAVFIILIFGFIACIWLRMYNLDIKPHVQEHQRRKMVNYATYDENSKTLFLHQRSAELANYIKIKNDKDIEISYKPQTLHIGSATVGGVTTGGAYTTGGYHYISGEHKNGLCRLEYTGCLIFKIQLNDAMYQKALQSPIKPYLNEKKQIAVINPRALSTEELQNALNSMKTTGYIGNDATKNGMPTYDKCKKIMDWITLVTQ